MIAIVPAAGTECARWHVVSRTGVGADVLAHVIVPVPASHDRSRAQPWLPAVRSLRDGDGQMTISATGDGHFRWTLVDEDGAMIAESPGVHRGAESCREAFRAAQEAARLALGGRRHQVVRTA